MSQAAAPALEPANLTVAPTDARAGHVAAAVIGNTLECYDFLTYAYFAPQIGAAFFPTHTPFAQLMLSLATFGAGFISRPLGAAVIGAYGDRVGRRPAMLVTFVLMGAAILALALIPSYAMIGPAAPVLVLIARLVQGLALGGDMGAATTFLVEAAPARRRGLYGAWQYAGQGIASLAAGLIGVGLSSLLSAHELQSFGWRIAFLIGAAILPFGLIMRRRIPETLHAAEPTETPVAGTLWRHARIVAIGLVLIASTGTQFYTLSYMTTYAAVFLHMKANVAFAATAVFGGCNLVFSLLGGAASDRIGRRPIMIWPRVALMVVIIPAFMLIASHRNAASLLGATAVLSVLGTFSASASLVSLTESLPKAIRCTTLALLYATATAIVGGTTQIAITWLLHSGGGVLAPAWWLLAATVVGTIAMALLGETAPARR